MPDGSSNGLERLGDSGDGLHGLLFRTARWLAIEQRTNKSGGRISKVEGVATAFFVGVVYTMGQRRA